MTARRVLMIAFHFPPIQGSSGMQRTLGLARHLPGFGWQPIVLTASQRAYPSVDAEQLQLIPDGTLVQRAFALDTARHLSLAGRYPRFLACPDRWISWVPLAILRGLRLIREFRPDIIWSTYPITSAHVIGSQLSKLSRIPWVADFRDPMVEVNPRTGALAPGNRSIREARLRIEHMCIRRAAALVFCTDGAKEICRERYPGLRDDVCHTIYNGFEERLFQDAESRLSGERPLPLSDAITILHSGTIYPTPDRDPRPFFDAIATLQSAGFFEQHSARFVLRATGHDDYLRAELERRSIAGLIELAPPIPYMDALVEMLSVDGLLLFQGYTSNPAIPAKLYEYLRAGKPLLALVDHRGSTAKLLDRFGTAVTADIESTDAIGNGLRRLIENIHAGRSSRLLDGEIARFSRQRSAESTAQLFDRLLDQTSVRLPWSEGT